MISQYPEHFHSTVTDAELINLYSKSKISLGFLEVYDQHDASKSLTRHLHLREFEAPMCGALYITGYSDELALFFEPDREVVVYRNVFELLEKVRYYLKRPDQAEKIRKAGYRRAIQEHTYHHRFESLFRHLGLQT
jgi:spore maturation protein CgeB